MENLETSLFFNSLENSTDQKVLSLCEEIKSFIKTAYAQVYLLDRILGVKKNLTYDIKDVVYVVIPDYPILVLFNDECSNEDIKNHLDDLKEDLGQLSAKYNYNYMLDRPRKWDEKWFYSSYWKNLDFTKYISDHKILQKEDIRKVELLISLITGSINDVEKIGEELPNNLLDKVKKQIMLLDGKQSHFIYNNDNQNEVRIQGMAGTGKTELLMRKIKELYVSEEKSKIAFTCHNRVLAIEMKSRIEKFFNFMKVEEQIDWENRLKVFHAWGSKYEENTGMYSYICKSYNIPFLNFKEAKSFEVACNQTIKTLKELDEVVCLFDYIFIDESQDFDNSFFELCKLVCKNTVYIAGDIFQSIFDETKDSDLKANYMLERCYRTDPRTLMFAHAIGLGLLENPPLYWLKDPEWEACGYKVIRNNNFILTREPLRRFNDVKSVKSILVEESNSVELLNLILNKISYLKDNNPTLKPGDLGIIIIDNNYNSMMQLSYHLQLNLIMEFGWSSTIGVETKYKDSNSVYISNENNVKGLEFPFTIIILLTDIGSSIKLRNSLYMSLTRSFITSFLIIDNEKVKREFIDTYIKASQSIENNGNLEVEEPTQEQKEKMKNKITMQKTAEQDIESKINWLLSQKKYVCMSNKDKELVINKTRNEWSNLSQDDILSKAEKLADSLL